MSKQRNYPEGLAEAVATIPFEQMQDFARKIMQPTTPEPARCVCGGPEGDCGCALGYADAVAEQRKKESAPLLTTEDAQSALDVFNQPKDWWPKIQAIASGRVVCIDTQTHKAVPVDQGEVVVTKDDNGQICFVSRQCEDGQVLGVIAESDMQVGKFVRFMTEAEAREKFEVIRRKDPFSNLSRPMDRDGQYGDSWMEREWRGWLAALRDLGVLLP